MQDPKKPKRDTDLVASFYDRSSTYEWERLSRHPMEYALTLRVLANYLPPPPARVLDCGGGPGRYALALTEQGYEVTLFDLSEGNLAFAREKASETGVRPADLQQGDARDLSQFADAEFDAVLLMGPLYHLLEIEDRRRAVREARRVLRPGGRMLASFITRYAAHLDLAQKDPARLLEAGALYERILVDGRLPPRSGQGDEFVAYFAHPTEARPFFLGCGLDVLAVLAQEGLTGPLEEHLKGLAPDAWQAWVDVNYETASEATIQGSAAHLLVVTERPRWQAALVRIGRTLTQTGVPYKVVGGTAGRLHGMDFPVNDLDLETTKEGAYRFGELFAAEVVDPVALRETETYRSHIGRFAFDGVRVEVLGEMARRENSDWVPTSALTTTIVELDGVPLPVSWLEEETLAYMRRGRLDRAGACLPHCDPERLRGLLRGEIPTNVV